MNEIPGARVAVTTKDGIASRFWYRFFEALALTANSGSTIRQLRTAVSINSAATDVATITGLPDKYLAVAFRVFDASTNLAASAATIGVYTGAGATGTTVVTPATITALTGATITTAMTVATGNVYLTAGTLYVRNGTAHGSAATVSVQIEVIDLTG